MDRRLQRDLVRQRVPEPKLPSGGIAYAMTLFLLGGVGGYMLGGGSQSDRGPEAASVVGGAPQTAASSVVDEKTLRPYRELLARDPKNLQAAVDLGNLLFDAKRFGEAVPFYRQALALNRTNVDISTDLGTALWQSGQADAALTQYARSLELNPTHALTLFNVGIVKSEGKSDFAGAIAAWETLLATNPGYDGATEVRGLIADARRKLTSRRL